MIQKRKTSSSPCTIVCVTDQFSCERLIHVGRKIADMSGTPLYVISSGRLSPTLNHEALEYLFTTSKEYGATMVALYSEAPFDTLLAYIRDSGAQHVVTGMPQAQNSILNTMWAQFPEKHFYTVDADSSYFSIDPDMRKEVTATCDQ